MDMQAFQIALSHLDFQVILYLFVGSMLMLIRNEARAITDEHFLLGMLAWPAVIPVWVVRALLIAIRGVRG